MALSPPVRRLKSRPITFVFEIPTDKLREFWEGLEKGKVYASKCKKCGKLSFPPTADCARCLNKEIEMVDIQGEGEIETFTHIVIRPASFQSQPTYTVTVAKMNSGVTVLAWLTGAKLSDVKVGAKVRLAAVQSPDGPSYGFTLVH
ncbi:MAG TPA: Zn-ribbon domain-containing OB-fold protein [Candidatus Acidoferrales bacterium]|nr:Zn-ribbon domain-containing OB-fold protein [Candidatus Acidoferrales bacterium]